MNGTVVKLRKRGLEVRPDNLAELLTAPFIKIFAFDPSLPGLGCGRSIGTGVIRKIVGDLVRINPDAGTEFSSVQAGDVLVLVPSIVAQ